MHRFARIAIALGVALFLSGCGTLLERAWRFGGQAEQVRQWARVEGRIEVDGDSAGVLVVVLARPGESPAEPPVGVDTFVRVRPGSYAFPVAPGRFVVGAYEDRNRNGLLDPDERSIPLSASPVLEVGPGARIAHDLTLAQATGASSARAEAVDVLGLVERTPAEQARFSLWAWSVQGSVCGDLGDPAFGPEAADRGLWEIVDFVNEGRAGIHFLEPYVPDRVPVLFVHGIRGSPQQFATLIDGLDRRRFQPWIYFYPSGFPLADLARHLSTLLQRLEARLHFDELAIIAHSMGGLVARGAILDYWRETGRDDVRLFVTFSTPWSGVEGAEKSRRSPVELPPSFADMKPSSDFLRRLFYEDGRKRLERRLPDGTEFHMLLGFRMRSRERRADDGTVSVASQARLEAQDQALTVRAFDRGHTEILHAPEARERLEDLLAHTFE